MTGSSSLPAGDDRIAIVIHALTGGGSEHAAALMASHWAAAGRPVTLITLAGIDTDTISLHPAVQRIGLNAMAPSKNPVQAAFANRARVRKLRAALHQVSPRHVIALTDRTAILTLLACRGTPWRAIVSERTDPRYHRIGRLWNWLRRRTYPEARCIVAQTEDAASALRPIAGRAPVVVIPNGVPLPSAADPEHPLLRNDQCPLGRARCVIGLGRLSWEKGFDRLISAFCRVAGDHPDWHLVIVGEGPERSRLEQQVRESALSGRIHLPGWFENPWSALQSADLFVLPSHYEGFPNALLEAMAAGLAVIAFDCPSGPAEIIQPDINGLLITNNDPEAMTTALSRLMADSLRREALGREARRVPDRFSLTRHFERWDELLAAQQP